jgi:RNA polymerase sigma factor (sigma-70 family)
MSVVTYLYAIAKNLIYKYHRKNELINRHKVRLYEHYRFISLKTDELENYSHLIHNALANMKEPCKTILNLFYIKGLKLAMIANTMEYTNVDVVKTQKSRCLKKLKEIVR